MKTKNIALMTRLRKMMLEELQGRKTLGRKIKAC